MTKTSCRHNIDWQIWCGDCEIELQRENRHIGEGTST